MERGAQEGHSYSTEPLYGIRLKSVELILFSVSTTGTGRRQILPR